MQGVYGKNSRHPEEAQHLHWLWERWNGWGGREMFWHLFFYTLNKNVLSLCVRLLLRYFPLVHPTFMLYWVELYYRLQKYTKPRWILDKFRYFTCYFLNRSEAESRLGLHFGSKTLENIDSFRGFIIKFSLFEPKWSPLLFIWYPSSKTEIETQYSAKTPAEDSPLDVAVFWGGKLLPNNYVPLQHVQRLADLIKHCRNSRPFYRWRREGVERQMIGWTNSI